MADIGRPSHARQPMWQRWQPMHRRGTWCRQIGAREEELVHQSRASRIVAPAAQEDALKREAECGVVSRHGGGGGVDGGGGEGEGSGGTVAATQPESTTWHTTHPQPAPRVLP